MSCPNRLPLIQIFLASRPSNGPSTSQHAKTNREKSVSPKGRGIPDEIEMDTRSPHRIGEKNEEEETRLSVLKCGQHDHRLKEEFVESDEGDHPQYDLYAIVCHAGMLGAGHYVTYVRHSNGKWYLYNDSSCKEVGSKDIDYSLAYILFYERRGLDYSRYIPDVSGRQAQDVDKVDEECEADVKRFCVIQ